MTDRAQDTEAIRAAHGRDYLERTIETVRNHRGADNCWPQWANIFADEIERCWAERDRLVARLEAAGQALREIRGLKHAPASALREYARAALAAAAPGETTPDAVVWSEPRQDYTGRVYRDGLATGTNAAPGETADEQRAHIMAAYEDGSGPAGQPPVRPASAAPGETTLAEPGDVPEAPHGHTAVASLGAEPRPGSASAAPGETEQTP